MPKIETTIQIDRPPAEVWRVLTDFDAFEQWNPMMVRVGGRPEPGTPLRIEVILREGRKPRKVGARVFVCEPERELRWGGGVRGLVWVEHWVHLEPHGAGTRVDHCESFGGLLARPGLWLLGINAGPYEAMNAALKRRVESSADLTSAKSSL